MVTNQIAEAFVASLGGDRIRKAIVIAFALASDDGATSVVKSAVVAGFSQRKGMSDTVGQENARLRRLICRTSSKNGECGERRFRFYFVKQFALP